ncbi:nuclease-related domain-containing protein [Acidihalobacter prosperus]|uniref:NERD domain-containing protein n=1 Tax=Acidihalobacter prosperus TaxID=160660 RepID=A0A1A6C360_9GAMM|nr:nuclease-related domain-containing protein [Acidihalobacter prosperus]OBS08998.1 hypothetical protein Thpro_022115 [Acidihalobacter prosperus]
MYRKHYAPWLGNLATMTVCLFAGTLMLAEWSLGNTGEMTPVYGGALLLVAWYAYRQYVRRAYGKVVERRAQRALKRAAAHTHWQARFNVPCASGGDIDALLIGADGRRVSVEIKSWSGLRVARGQLVKLNGKPPFGDPIGQALREGQSTGAWPLLWLPVAGRRGRFTYRGVMIVMGDASYLMQVLGRC